MIQEDKKLLIKDLCARLPYRVKIHVDYTFKPPYNVHLETDCGLVEFNVEKGEYLALTDMDNYSARKRFALENIKPYLRPMSSMTEEEFEDLKSYSGLIYGQLDLAPFQNGTYKCLDFYLNEVPSDVVILVFDWLNKNHFDYRGLIEMGLALEAPEGMYKTE